MPTTETVPTPPSPPLTILAAIDYSQASDLVVQRAVAMARSGGAGELHFLHVNQGERNREAQEARRAELMDWLAARLGGFDAVPAGVSVVCHEAKGAPEHVIVEMASDLRADLVVVGIHARTSMQRQRLGSVSQIVVQDCGCPVLVVRGIQHEEPLPQGEPACPDCLETRTRSHGDRLWCERHGEKHGRCHLRFSPRPTPTQRRTVS